MNDFDLNGFKTLPILFGPERCHEILNQVNQQINGVAGQREFLEYEWCQGLARELLEHPILKQFLPQHYGAVQCTYFEKSNETNWLVPVHQDLNIPVKHKIAHPDLPTWSIKQERCYTQAPASLLQDLIALRLHLDDCGQSDGPLMVIGKTHQMGKISAEDASEIKARSTITPCIIDQGAALLMRPLLLHMSSKANGISKRRVLHFLFAPPCPIDGLEYQHFVVN